MNQNEALCISQAKNGFVVDGLDNAMTGMGTVDNLMIFPSLVDLFRFLTNHFNPNNEQVEDEETPTSELNQEEVDILLDHIDEDDESTPPTYPGITAAEEEGEIK